MGSVVVMPAKGDAIDAPAAMAAVPDLLAAGVTDVRLFMPVPASGAELTDQLRAFVAAFRDAVGSARRP